jgi:hypothetical protein
MNQEHRRKMEHWLSPIFWPMWSEIDDAVEGAKRADREAGWAQLVMSRGTTGLAQAERSRLKLEYQEREVRWKITVANYAWRMARVKKIKNPPES